MFKIIVFLFFGNFILLERILCFFILGDLKIFFKMFLLIFWKVLIFFVFLCMFVVKVDLLEKVNVGESWILELLIFEFDFLFLSVRLGLGFFEVFLSIVDFEFLFGCNVGFFFWLGINLIMWCIVGKFGEEECVLCIFFVRGCWEDVVSILFGVFFRNRGILEIGFFNWYGVDSMMLEVLICFCDGGYIFLV